MNRKKALWLLGLGVVLATAFIFSNSFKGIGASNQDSDSVISIFEPLIRRIFGENHNIDLHFWVRKGAHFAEFALLGMLVYGWCLVFSRTAFGYGLFYLLAVAVCDEFIQRFFERTSSVADVLLDFGGAFTGFCLLSGMIILFNNRKKRGKKHGN